MSVEDVSFRQACKVIVRNGYTPVETKAYERLRAWLDTTNGWPPVGWEPTTNEQYAPNRVCPHGLHFGGYYCDDCHEASGTGGSE